MPALRLDNYFILESHFDSKTEGVTDEFANVRGVTLSPEIVDARAEVAIHKDDKTKFQCKLTVEPKQAIHCGFKVVMLGLFTVDETWMQKPGNVAEKLVLITGASILYSSAREHLLTLTSRGVYPALMLPTVQFNVGPTAKPEAESPAEVLEK